MKNKPEVKILELRGQIYIRIKQKGQPTRTWKYYTEIPQKLYEREYQQTIKEKRRPKIGQIRKAVKEYGAKITLKKATRRGKEYQKTQRYIKRHPKLAKIIKKGKSTITITDALHKTKEEIEKKTKQLLSRMVYDKEILKILNKEENLTKMRHRFFYQITGIDENNKITGTYQEGGTRTPKEEIESLKGQIDRPTISGVEPSKIEGAKRINIKIIFSKGK